MRFGRFGRVVCLIIEGRKDLAMELTGKVKEIYTVGDTRQPCSIKDAISNAYVAAYNI